MQFMQIKLFFSNFHTKFILTNFNHVRLNCIKKVLLALLVDLGDINNNNNKTYV